jgi:hypothetical protein
MGDVQIHEFSLCQVFPECIIYPDFIFYVLITPYRWPFLFPEGSLLMCAIHEYVLFLSSSTYSAPQIDRAVTGRKSFCSRVFWWWTSSGLTIKGILVVDIKWADHQGDSGGGHQVGWPSRGFWWWTSSRLTTKGILVVDSKWADHLPILWFLVDNEPHCMVQSNELWPVMNNLEVVPVVTNLHMKWSFLHLAGNFHKMYHCF